MPAESYVPILLVNDAPIEISSFSLDCPEGRIGVALSFDCTDPLPDIERGMSVDFSIAVNGSPIPLIVGGYVVGRNKSVASGDSSPNPRDTFSFTAADSLGERRLSLSPRIPMILYDPAFVTISSAELDTKINDSEGLRIYSAYQDIDDLDLLQILDYAYITGCGFADVITNIPNYAIRRAEFPLTASFHESVASYYAPYRPQIYEQDNTLFIIAPRLDLPDGFDPDGAVYTTADFISMQRSKPDVQPVNALLMTTRITGDYVDLGSLPGGVTERTETDTQSSGDTLDGDFQQSVVLRRIAQLHEDSADPSRITSEVTFETVTTTTAQDETGTSRTMMIETQTELFDYNYRLNLGFDRSVDAYIKRPDELANTENVLTERLRIIWSGTGTFGEFIKDWELKNVEGLIMLQGEDPDIVKSSLMDANRFGAVPEDATVERGPISSKITRFRETGPDQVEMIVQETDHMAGRSVPKSPQHHTGTIRVQLRGTNADGTTQTLLRDLESEALYGPRKPITWDGAGLPFDQALPVALQALADAIAPPETLRVTLLQPDFDMQRGHRRQVAVNRNDNLKPGFVTSYSLRGSPGARGMCVLTQEFNMQVTN